MSNDSLVTVKRALISVSDKTGLVDFARSLRTHNIEILSTGGTFKMLVDNNIEATEVSEHTGFPEMMDGRVKTLHPTIAGGILGRRGQDDEVMAHHNIAPIDMVVVNLYPFEKTVANPECTLADAIENIDIGGPTMVRAAAKNHRSVAIVVKHQDYAHIVQELDDNQGQLALNTRFDLAVKAFEHTAHYDGAIANYFGTRTEDADTTFPRTLNLQFTVAESLRYGENPHQASGFYKEQPEVAGSIASAKQLQGKALSYNNIADTDAALETVKLFEQAACVIVKHANPCGVAEADDLLTAYQSAYDTDSESAFGGIIAFNRELTGDVAHAIVEQQFVEVIIAPSATAEAQEMISRKKNVRLLVTGELTQPQNSWDYKRVNGGLLVQDRDLALINVQDLNIVTKRQPTDAELADCLFTWKVAKMVKSNAIVYGKDARTIGVGAGQMSRVNSARIAAIKAEHAGLTVAGAVMASDAFFPFRDGIDNAANNGIRCVIQPGGSIRDDEVIAAADEHDIAMVFTGVRHFRH